MKVSCNTIYTRVLNADCVRFVLGFALFLSPLLIDVYGLGHASRLLFIVLQDLKDYMRQAGEVTYADAHKQRRNEG